MKPETIEAAKESSMRAVENFQIDSLPMWLKHFSNNHVHRQKFSDDEKKRLIDRLAHELNKHSNGVVIMVDGAPTRIWLDSGKNVKATTLQDVKFRL